MDQQQQRLELQTLLETLLGDNAVYFQPPANIAMVYPCIVYNLDNAKTEFADNNPYRFTKRYQVTVIDRNPDTKIPDDVAKLPMCIFNRFYTADNLNHYVFNIFF